MPWAGGLNAAHHNTMDLNDDGKDDLVIFDRTADKVITFLNDNNQYRICSRLRELLSFRYNQLVVVA